MGKKYSIKWSLLFLSLTGSLYFSPDRQLTENHTVIRMFSQTDNTGRIFLFMLDPEGYVSYIRQSVKNGAWGNDLYIKENIKNPAPVPGPVPLRPKPDFQERFEELAIGLNTQSRMVMVGLSLDKTAWYTIQDRFEPDNWSEWKKMRGSSFLHIAAIRNLNGSFQVFGITGPGDVLYSVESADPLDPEKFTPWKSLGALNLDQISCGKSASGLVTVFAKNKIYGSVYHTWQLQPGAESWSAWSPLEGIELKSIEVNRNPDGRFTLLAIGGDERLYERHQLTPEGAWSDWTTFDGSTIKQIVTETSQAGRITVFALRGDGSAEVIWQLNPGGNDWSGWYPFGGNKFRYIAGSRNEDGRMILFAADAGLELQCTAQVAPDGAWDGWKKLVN